MKALPPRTGYAITDPPSLPSLATESIRRRIIDGDLAPGSRLIEETISAELGISRPPVREALRALAGEGLVELVPRRGAVVISFTLQDVFEIVTFRESLERAAVDLALPAPPADRLAALHEAADILEQNAHDGREDLAVTDSARFHEALVGLAGNARLSAAYRALSHQLQILMRLNRQARRGSESLEQRAARHRGLVRAIEAGDRAAVLNALHGGTSLGFLLDPAIDLSTGDERAKVWLDRARRSPSEAGSGTLEV